jgi:hypothetical protein
VVIREAAVVLVVVVLGNMVGKRGMLAVQEL